MAKEQIDLFEKCEQLRSVMLEDELSNDPNCGLLLFGMFLAVSHTAAAIYENDAQRFPCATETSELNFIAITQLDLHTTRRQLEKIGEKITIGDFQGAAEDIALLTIADDQPAAIHEPVSKIVSLLNKQKAA